MKFNEINQKFTEKVAEYLSKGYIVNTATMNGSQGELAHIDLTDGNEIIRVLLATDIESDDTGTYNTLCLVVGRAEAGIVPNSSNSWQSIWNTRLEVLERERWYELYSVKGETVYGAKEEARTVRDKQVARYMNKRSNDSADITNDKTCKIVTPLIRRKAGVQRVNRKKIHVKRSSKGFQVIYAGWTITLA